MVRTNVGAWGCWAGGYCRGWWLRRHDPESGGDRSQPLDRKRTLALPRSGEDGQRSLQGDVRREGGSRRGPGRGRSPRSPRTDAPLPLERLPGGDRKLRASTLRRHGGRVNARPVAPVDGLCTAWGGNGGSLWTGGGPCWGRGRKYRPACPAHQHDACAPAVEKRNLLACTALALVQARAQGATCCAVQGATQTACRQVRDPHRRVRVRRRRGQDSRRRVGTR